MPQSYEPLSNKYILWYFRNTDRAGTKPVTPLLHHEKNQIMQCSPFDMGNQGKVDLNLKYTLQLTLWWAGTALSQSL